MRPTCNRRPPPLAVLLSTSVPSDQPLLAGSSVGASDVVSATRWRLVELPDAALNPRKYLVEAVRSQPAPEHVKTYWPAVVGLVPESVASAVAAGRAVLLASTARSVITAFPGAPVGAANSTVTLVSV